MLSVFVTERQRKIENMWKSCVTTIKKNDIANNANYGSNIN